MNGTAYLVMDYYEGETLYDYLARQSGKKLPWRQAVNLLLPVLDGLAEVHRNGFMHRDVKPRNLYLTQRGQLVLLDFGAARQVVSDDRTRSLAIYTNGYAAYEQQQHVQGEQGLWTDVYSVAATLYFALTAHVPPPASEWKQEICAGRPGISAPTCRRRSMTFWIRRWWSSRKSACKPSKSSSSSFGRC